MEFSEEFELRLDFECVNDRFSTGYLNLSDLLKNNKFTFSGLDSFQENQTREEPHNPEMYSIGDEDEEFQVPKRGGITDKSREEQGADRTKQKKIKETENKEGDFEELEDLGDIEDLEDLDDLEIDEKPEEFENDDLDDEEYFKKLEEEA